MDVYGELRKVVKEERRERFKIINIFHSIKKSLIWCKETAGLVWEEIEPGFYIAMTVCGIVSLSIFILYYVNFINGYKINHLFAFKVGIAISLILLIGSFIRLLKADRDKFFRKWKDK